MLSHGSFTSFYLSDDSGYWPDVGVYNLGPRVVMSARRKAQTPNTKSGVQARSVPLLLFMNDAVLCMLRGSLDL